MKRRVSAHEIAETGRKAAKRDREFALRMPADQLCDILQVFAVIADGNLDKLSGSRRRGGEIARLKHPCEVGSVDRVRAEADHQRSRGGHHIFYAIHGLGGQRGEKRKRFIAIGEFNEDSGKTDGKD
jgi:hypothetical protein